MPALALTDYGNMFGVLELYFQARERGIKPLIGTACYYVEDCLKKESNSGENFRLRRMKTGTLTLIAKNQTGYKNLCQISTLACQDGFYFVPRADYKIFEKYREGVMALALGGRSAVFQTYKNKGPESAGEEIRKLKKIFGDSFYLGFQSRGVESWKEYNDFLAETAPSENIPLVAENDIHYLERGDSLLQDVLFCIGVNRTLNDRERERLGPPEFFLKSPEEMKRQFEREKVSWSDEYRRACDRTLEVADQCDVEFKVKDKAGRPVYHLPRSVKGEKWGPAGLRKMAFDGLNKRFEEADGRGEGLSLEQKETYRKRVDHELNVIEEMGFTGYFHIVEDFIRWAKNHGIPVGPGRGSGSSSLVSYCLGITDLDPIPLHLIFERFLNPERISMPDFDIDFCQENRPRVIQYITDKYGSGCTSHLITYGRLSVRAAIRDAGRVLGLSYGDTDQIAKLIPDKLGITLKEALKMEPRLRTAREENPQTNELLEVTGLLEGLIRHTGIHAAGIIIADTPITDYAPLYRGAEGENVVQYDLKHVEKIGLVKFDFLGLKTLTHISETFRLIKENQGKEISTRHISLKDPGIYEIMCQGDTVGVFQFEGRGITELLIKSQPTCFEDIIAINALYRPGPMNMIPSYLDRKKGRIPVKYIFPDLEPILNETYGIIVYQEQVHQIAVKIAGYSYREADVLRRAMGKKISSVMAKQKDRFLKGAGENNHDLKKAEELFDLMAEFAKYGFNKAHASAYCVLAAQTAWLKHHYPVEFFASQMTIDRRDSEKVSRAVEDAVKHNIKVLPPHVNHSRLEFSVEGRHIRFSLGAVKGVGDLCARAVVSARGKMKNRKFSSVEEFFNAVDLKQINKKAFDNLVKSGAFDDFHYNRREIFESYEKFFQYSKTVREAEESGQRSLFSSDSHSKKEDSVQPAPLKNWSFEERMGFEKEVIGFYLSDHPLRSLKGLERAFNCCDLSLLDSIPENRPIQVLALIRDFKEVMTKKTARMMAFGHLEGVTGRVEVILFPDVYEKIRGTAFKEGDIVFVKGILQKDGEKSQRIVAESVIPLEDRFKAVHRIQLSLHPDMEERDLNGLRDLLRESAEGRTSVSIRAFLPEEKVFVTMDLRNTLMDLKINRDFIEKAYKFLKDPDRLRLVCGESA